jgi:hypothetical protein
MEGLREETAEQELPKVEEECLVDAKEILG